MASEKTVSDRVRWIDAISRMIELTQSGELEWRIGEYYGPGWEDPTTPPYIAVYKGTIYRLQGRWVRREVREKPIGGTFNILKVLTVNNVEGEVIRLEMIDRKGRTLYRVPSVDPIRDLLYAVQRQTADPDAALQDLLG